MRQSGVTEERLPQIAKPHQMAMLLMSPEQMILPETITLKQFETPFPSSRVPADNTVFTSRIFSSTARENKQALRSSAQGGSLAPNPMSAYQGMSTHDLMLQMLSEQQLLRKRVESIEDSMHHMEDQNA